jgi:hypothetical protein
LGAAEGDGDMLEPSEVSMPSSISCVFFCASVTSGYLCFGHDEPVSEVGQPG